MPQQNSIGLKPFRKKSSPFDAVGEARRRFPELRDWTDNEIRRNLRQPERFRSAFPEYANLDDETIRRNLPEPALSLRVEGQRPGGARMGPRPSDGLAGGLPELRPPMVRGQFGQPIPSLAELRIRQQSQPRATLGPRRDMVQEALDAPSPYGFPDAMSGIRQLAGAIRRAATAPGALFGPEEREPERRHPAEISAAAREAVWQPPPAPERLDPLSSAHRVSRFGVPPVREPRPRTYEKEFQRIAEEESARTAPLAPGQKPLLRLEELVNVEKHPRLYGAMRALSGFTTAESGALIAGTMGLPGAAARIVSGKFTWDMLRGLDAPNAAFQEAIHRAEQLANEGAPREQIDAAIRDAEIAFGEALVIGPMAGVLGAHTVKLRLPKRTLGLKPLPLPETRSVGEPAPAERLRGARWTPRASRAAQAGFIKLPELRRPTEQAVAAGAQSAPRGASEARGALTPEQVREVFEADARMFQPPAPQRRSASGALPEGRKPLRVQAETRRVVGGALRDPDLLQMLTPAERTALTLRYVEGRSLEEIGRTLGLRPQSTAIKLSRAVQKLRKAPAAARTAPPLTAKDAEVLLDRIARIERLTGPVPNKRRTRRIDARRKPSTEPLTEAERTVWRSRLEPLRAELRLRLGKLAPDQLTALRSESVAAAKRNRAQADEIGRVMASAELARAMLDEMAPRAEVRYRRAEIVGEVDARTGKPVTELQRIREGETLHHEVREVIHGAFQDEMKRIAEELPGDPTRLPEGLRRGVTPEAWNETRSKTQKRLDEVKAHLRRRIEEILKLPPGTAKAELNRALREEKLDSGRDVLSEIVELRRILGREPTKLVFAQRGRPFVDEAGVVRMPGVAAYPTIHFANLVFGANRRIVPPREVFEAKARELRTKAYRMERLEELFGREVKEPAREAGVPTALPELIPPGAATAHEALAAVVREAGGIFKGIQKGDPALRIEELVYVDVPPERVGGRRGVTAAIPSRELSPESVRAALERKIGEFSAKGALETSAPSPKGLPETRTPEIAEAAASAPSVEGAKLQDELKFWREHIREKVKDAFERMGAAQMHQPSSGSRFSPAEGAHFSADLAASRENAILKSIMSERTATGQTVAERIRQIQRQLGSEAAAAQSRPAEDLLGSPDAVLERAQRAGVEAWPLDQRLADGSGWISPEGRVFVSARKATHDRVLGQIFGVTDARLLRDLQQKALDKGWIQRADRGTYQLGRLTDEAIKAIEPDVLRDLDYLAAQRQPIIIEYGVEPGAAEPARGARLSVLIEPRELEGRTLSEVIREKTRSASEALDPQLFSSPMFNPRFWEKADELLRPLTQRVAAALGRSVDKLPYRLRRQLKENTAAKAVLQEARREIGREESEQRALLRMISRAKLNPFESAVADQIARYGLGDPKAPSEPKTALNLLLQKFAKEGLLRPEKLPDVMAVTERVHQLAQQHTAERAALGLPVREEWLEGPKHWYPNLFRRKGRSPLKASMIAGRLFYGPKARQIGPRVTDRWVVVNETGNLKKVDAKTPAVFKSEAEARAFAEQRGGQVMEPMSHPQLVAHGLIEDLKVNLREGFSKDRALIAQTRALETIGRDLAVDEARPGYVKLTGISIPAKLAETNPHIARLRDGYVPREVADTLTAFWGPRGALRRAFERVESVLRRSVTAWNPIRHGRQYLENEVLLAFGDTAASLNKLAQGRAAADYFRSVYGDPATVKAPFWEEYSRSKLPESDYVRGELEKVWQTGGFGTQEFASRLLHAVEKDPNAGIAELFERAATESLTLGEHAGQAVRFAGKGIRTKLAQLENLYRHHDQVYKYYFYRTLRERGTLTHEAAERRVLETFFDYNDVPPILRAANKAIPFVPNVLYQLTRILGTALRDRPATTTLKIGLALSAYAHLRSEALEQAGITDDDLRNMERFGPNVGQVPLPMTDSKGRALLLDLRWLIPFADVAYLYSSLSEEAPERGAAQLLRRGIPMVAQPLATAISGRDVFGTPVTRGTETREEFWSKWAKAVAQSATPGVLGQLWHRLYKLTEFGASPERETQPLGVRLASPLIGGVQSLEPRERIRLRQAILASKARDLSEEAARQRGRLLRGQITPEEWREELKNLERATESTEFVHPETLAVVREIELGRGEQAREAARRLSESGYFASRSEVLGAVRGLRNLRRRLGELRSSRLPEAAEAAQAALAEQRGEFGSVSRATRTRLNRELRSLSKADREAIKKWLRQNLADAAAAPASE